MRQIVVILLLFIPTLWANEVRLGVGAGYTFLQRDIKEYWESSPQFGVDVAYPFKVPVMLSVYGSKHDPIQQGADSPYKQVDYQLLFISMKLQFEYTFLKTRSISPLVGAGLSNSTFFVFEEWPPVENDDESEPGLTFSTGLKAKLPKNFDLSLIYYQSILSTEPRAITYGNAILRCTWRVGGKDEK